MINQGIVDEIRNKEGNIRYEYFLPLDSKSTLLLIDEWENQEALDKHHQSEVMEKIIKLRDKFDLTMEVSRYTSIDNNLMMKNILENSKLINTLVSKRRFFHKNWRYLV